MLNTPGRVNAWSLIRKHLQCRGNHHHSMVRGKGIIQDLHYTAITDIDEEGGGRPLRDGNLRRGIEPDTLRGIQEDSEKSTLLQVGQRELMLVMILCEKAAGLLIHRTDSGLAGVSRAFACRTLGQQWRRHIQLHSGWRELTRAEDFSGQELEHGSCRGEGWGSPLQPTPIHKQAGVHGRTLLNEDHGKPSSESRRNLPQLEGSFPDALEA